MDKNIRNDQQASITFSNRVQAVNAIVNGSPVTEESKVYFIQKLPASTKISRNRMNWKWQKPFLAT
jgi:hypothetical protein